MQRTKVLFLSTVMVGSLCTSSFSVSEDPLQQFKIASQAYQNGRYDTAEQEYEAFLKHFAKHRLAPEAEFALGEIKFALKKYPDAADYYSAVVKHYGGTYTALNAELRLGQCEFNMKKYLNSIDHFEVVKKKAPKV